MIVVDAARRLFVLAAALVIMGLIAIGCAASVTTVQAPASAGSSGEAAAPPAATAAPSPRPTAAPTQTAVPTPTTIPAPTATTTPVPSPTPVDATPVVIQGDGWAITEADVERLTTFVETTHELAFRAPVLIETSPDIGEEYAPDLDIFAENDWRLLNALGLIREGFDRDGVNQLRRDRIRGLCCRGDEGDLIVIVEALATKFETEVILVHELVHALHRQYPEIVGDVGRSGGFELPDTYGATFESIAQLVAFAYFDSQPLDQQAEIEDELLIVDDQLAELTGRVPGEMLNFAYFTAPGLAEAVFEARGAQGLSDLLSAAPTTTEQIVYPERWLAGEDRVSQDPPPVPRGAIFVTEGRLGVALLGWMVDEIAGPDGADPVLADWTGDRYTLYEFDGRDCVSATIELDEQPSTELLADWLGELFDLELESTEDRRVSFDTCAASDA